MDVYIYKHTSVFSIYISIYFYLYENLHPVTAKQFKGWKLIKITTAKLSYNSLYILIILLSDENSQISIISGIFPFHNERASSYSELLR